MPSLRQAQDRRSGYGGHIAQQHDSLTEYYLADALGSVRQLTNSGGEVVLARSYDPYGNLVDNTAYAGVTTAYSYAGEFTDPSGMVYLRARYYSPVMGRFVSKDVWEGDEEIPISYNKWIYAYENPIKVIDPSGKYGEEVHYKLTRKLVNIWSDYYGIVLVGLAENIAKWDNRVDYSPVLQPGGSCISCHFMPFSNTISHVESAIASKEPYLFGATLHQLQDYFSHWNEGYTPETLGHLNDSIKAKQRNAELKKEFFATHPKEEVKQDIRNRNPGIDLSRLNGWELIDIYLRKELDDTDWENRVTERQRYGFNPDFYEATSKRDTTMINVVHYYISDFIQILSNEECINLYDPPDHIRETIAQLYLIGY